MWKVAALLALAACQSFDVSRVLGAECGSDSDCAEKCLAGQAWPAGFCTTVCDDDSQCGGGARCISEDGGVCVFDCTIDSDCLFLGSTYTCQSVSASSGQVMVCRGG